MEELAVRLGGQVGGILTSNSMRNRAWIMRRSGWILPRHQLGGPEYLGQPLVAR